MKLATVLFAFAFGSLTLAAQNVRPVRWMVQRGMDVSAGCPVALHLDQSAVGASAQVKNGQRTMPYQTRLHLIASGAKQGKYRASEIKTAQVTVYGLDTTPRFELTWSVQGSRLGPAKNMKVSFVSGSNGSAEADFLVEALPAVSQIEVNSLTFANGSIWKPLPGRTCTVTPDPFVLVSDQSH